MAKENVPPVRMLANSARVQLILGISKATFYRWISKLPPPIRIHGQLHWWQDEIIAWVETHRETDNDGDAAA